MSITLPALVDDPALYLFAFDFDQDVAQVLAMDRSALHRSIFLDGRIERSKAQIHRISLPVMLDAYKGPPLSERPVGMIFHVAQCGSTLLARALDHPGKSLSLREPYALRQLGVLAGGDAHETGKLDDVRYGQMLHMALSMYGKRWPFETAVVVKANVPVNCIAEQVMGLNPQAPAVTLYFGLEDYVAAVMRTEGHENWVETVYAELRLDRHPLVSDAVPGSTAERTAALWFMQMKAFEAVLDGFANTRSLDAADFLDNPQPAIAAAAELFGVALSEAEMRDMVAGDLFQTYSKNPTLDYDPEVRLAREAQSKKRLAGAIDAAFAWAEAAKARHGLVESFAKPLSGEARPLLRRG